jgi:hypothetical protein
MDKKDIYGQEEISKKDVISVMRNFVSNCEANRQLLLEKRSRENTIQEVLAIDAAREHIRQIGKRIVLLSDRLDKSKDIPFTDREKLLKHEVDTDVNAIYKFQMETAGFNPGKIWEKVNQHREENANTVENFYSRLEEIEQHYSGGKLVEFRLNEEEGEIKDTWIPYDYYSDLDPGSHITPLDLMQSSKILIEQFAIYSRDTVFMDSHLKKRKQEIENLINKLYKLPNLEINVDQALVV